jgi:hypothetical protein
MARRRSYMYRGTERERSWRAPRSIRAQEIKMFHQENRLDRWRRGIIEWRDTEGKNKVKR